MDGILLVSAIYWIAVALTFLIGLIKTIIASINDRPVKEGVKLMIGAVIMLVIGAGACAVLLSGLGGGH